MNIGDLVNRLQKLKIPNSWFLIGGRGITDNKTCLRFIDNQWVVYYSERGGKYKLKTFGSEDAACKELLVRMKLKKGRKK